MFLSVGFYITVQTALINYCCENASLCFIERNCIAKNVPAFCYPIITALIIPAVWFCRWLARGAVISLRGSPLYWLAVVEFMFKGRRSVINIATSPVGMRRNVGMKLPFVVWRGLFASRAAATPGIPGTWWCRTPWRWFWSHRSPSAPGSFPCCGGRENKGKLVMF